MADVTSVQVTAPSRLLFGLSSFGHAAVPQYGGVGLMLQEPQVRLRITESSGSEWEFYGPGAARAELFAKRWVVSSGNVVRRGCRIVVQQLPPSHAGLGSGTQLALSVAAGLNHFFCYEQPSPCDLARSVGRADRSTVGTFGFVHGGLIWETGKNESHEDARLNGRWSLLEDWRVVLIRAVHRPGISGDAERQAFRQLPPVPPEVTRALLSEVSTRMVPAVEVGDFDKFSESVYAYGKQAGECFATIQGGPYAGENLACVIETLRDWGIRGVGQSSWGPTVFALVPNSQSVGTLMKRVRSDLDDCVEEVMVSQVNNVGASVDVECLT